MNLLSLAALSQMMLRSREEKEEHFKNRIFLNFFVQNVFHIIKTTKPSQNEQVKILLYLQILKQTIRFVIIIHFCECPMA